MSHLSLTYRKKLLKKVIKEITVMISLIWIFANPKHQCYIAKFMNPLCSIAKQEITRSILI